MPDQSSGGIGWEIHVLDGPGRGQVVAIQDDLVIGRAATEAGRLGGDAKLSRTHAVVALRDDGTIWITDLGSANGTSVNDHRLGSAHELKSGDRIRVGSSVLELREVAAARPGVQTTVAQRSVDPSAVASQLLPQTRQSARIGSSSERIRIGRDPSNDLVLSHPNVSRFHAEVVRTNGQSELRELGSRHGTYVDGHAVRRTPVSPGSRITIGPFRLQLDEAEVASTVASARLTATEVVVDAKDVRLLHPTSLTINPGTFVGIIGGSGTGKTTLLKCLAGAISPSEGAVAIDGDPVETRRAVIGYVPQDEIVHPLLTVREALGYAARLRLPDDTDEEEIHQATASVIDELELQEHAETRIANLSGGQRKRVGVGSELVNQPQLLLLDEATTGLDPILERRMMQMMRALADRGRTVVTVTHATANLDLCHDVVVMGEGGHVCFSGSPQDARTFFGVGTTGEIYGALDSLPTDEWQRRWKDWSSAVRSRIAAQSPAAHRPPRLRRNPVRQAVILTRRYFKIFLRDRRNLVLLTAQVPVLAAAIAELFPSNIWSARSPDGGAGMVFLIVTLGIWLGTIDSSREIIKERPVVERESAVGVGRVPYLFSKAAVLGALAVLQSLLLLGVVALLRPGVPNGAAFVAVVLATTWTAVAMGLLISASVRTDNQAVSLIPLALIPQLLFAGQIVPYAPMAGVLKAITYVIFARWAFAGAGHAAQIPSRLPPHVLTMTFGHGFFSVTPAGAIGILAIFVAVFVAASLMRLPRGAR